MPSFIVAQQPAIFTTRQPQQPAKVTLSSDIKAALKRIKEDARLNGNLSDENCEWLMENWHVCTEALFYTAWYVWGGRLWAAKIRKCVRTAEDMEMFIAFFDGNIDNLSMTMTNYLMWYQGGYHLYLPPTAHEQKRFDAIMSKLGMVG